VTSTNHRVGQDAIARTSGLPKVGGLAAWKIQRVRAFMEARLDRAISVADLATLARVSPSHFSRGFRTSLGDSPHSYLLRLRIERSLVLLKDTDLSLCLVATECGFSDQAHFNRVFKQRLGGSPGTWRRAHRNPFASEECRTCRSEVSLLGRAHDGSTNRQLRVQDTSGGTDDAE
jgi:transcriptional regulator GlxA family with amidase domain